MNYIANMSIFDTFNQYFEMVSANTDKLRQEVYQLRYQVYCVERNFLNSSAEEGIECDKYDAHSSHYLIRHRDTNCYVATTRLILSDSNNPEKLFPMETYSQIDNAELFKVIRRANVAELSRFCISKQFRQRTNDKRGLIITNDENHHYFSRRNKNSSIHLTLALFACAIRMSSEHDIHYWCAIMDTALKRVVSTLGIHVIEIGLPRPSIHYYGLRQPCIIKVDNLLQGVAEKNLDYWTIITQNGKYGGTAIKS